MQANQTNQAERERWNDPFWSEHWPKRERFTESVTPLLLRALELKPGERVLDIGCGGGPATSAAAAMVGNAGQAVGADISVPLVDLARKRAAASGAGNISFQVKDVQQDRVDGGPFDAAMSQFGVMFFDEPKTAFANIRAQLMPGGRLAFACWQSPAKNPWFLGPLLADLVPPPPQPPPGQEPDRAVRLRRSRLCARNPAVCRLRRHRRRQSRLFDRGARELDD